MRVGVNYVVKVKKRYIVYLIKDVINGRFLPHKQLHQKSYESVSFHNYAIKKKKKEKRKTKTKKKNHNTHEGIEKYLKQGYFHKIYLLENFRKMNYKSPNSSFNI